MLDIQSESSTCSPALDRKTFARQRTHLEQEGAEITGDMLFAKSADFALAKQKQPEMAVKFNEMKTNHP